jgi:3-hydroxyisobutyrate dehydrogenase-like beta-hydroxyacid dehydrogenase
MTARECPKSKDQNTMATASGSKRILLLHPGQMGHAVGAALKTAGHAVAWVAEGRSAASAERAKAAGLAAVPALDAGLADAEIVLSVCPPDAAEALAGEVAERGFAGVFIDANAIAPETARRIGGRVERRGAGMVDGGIVGPPPLSAGTTRLFLSGDAAPMAAALFAGTTVEAIPVGAAVGAASALKMAYAAWTKGTSALFIAIRALARAEGVEAPLIEEWQRSQPTLMRAKTGAAEDAIAKAWRFAGEMEEIASSFEANGLPGGFHQAAAELYRKLESLKDDDRATIEAALDLLSAGRRR